MCYFATSRLLFILYQFKLNVGVSASDFIQIALRGSWMDLSMTGYIMLLSSLLLGALFATGSQWHRAINKVLTLILLILFSIIVVVDWELYRNWHYRIDATPLYFLSNPKEAMASLTFSANAILAVVIALYIWVFYFLYKRLTRNALTHIEREKWWVLPCFIGIAAFMILPIRGGLGTAPMNPSKVYFSQNSYCNHAALNAPWNFFYAVSKSGDINHRYPDMVTDEVAQAQFPLLMSHIADSTNIILRTERPNVVVILLESFTAKAISAVGGMSNITPNIDKLANEGVLFTNMYSAADRSDKGIVATLAGFPAQPINSVIKYPSKSSKLPTISQSLVENGYSATFYYGGDPTFASIRSFLYSSRFGRIVSQDNFPKEFRNSKWGVHDEYVFTHLLNDMDTARSPFFKVLFTLTSHEPFELPGKPTHKLQNNEEEMFLNTIHYTDSCLGHFIEQAKTRSWYANTLFVLVADHGHRLPYNDPNHAPQKFHIPMLWLGGALGCTPQKVDKVCSQFDLATTLLTQMNIDTHRFKFSKDVLNPTTEGFAFYVFNNGYGFITSTDTLIRDQTSQTNILRNGSTPIDTLTAKAGAFHRIYQDYFIGL